jgi:hypothetical protein
LACKITPHSSAMGSKVFTSQPSRCMALLCKTRNPLFCNSTSKKW